ncbi:hypothetical protein Gain_0027_064 [Komagataeibacter intermedius TF2]|uniref:Putative exodeoxyribonuclease 8 PDDEXK-like domain-containing protein n=2 Tax=Komagataeibacter intermedius TaxID=66229 RepID=A0ABQ0PH94_9PROT|nr:hypothetical protein Gain_0027_064 [Komagataeibacter intermedius TF2]GBQ68075.1 hypothetical protein AA0521_1147 [Komagataeibacter intermedius NRIC 0521]
MAQIITQPGIYSMSSEEYHADPCRPMSLSSSGARALASDCPAQFIYDRQNAQHKQCFDIGTAGHLMVLEPHLFDEQIVVVEGRTADGKPSAGYKSKDAIEQRDAAYKAGKTPLLKSEVEMVRAMRAQIWDDPVASKAFRDGRAEQSMFWKDPEFGIWCRTRPDFVPSHGRYLVDYKTAASSNPRDFEKAMFNCGYHQQAAWYLDGYEAVTGQRPKAFWFIVQAKKPPYLVSLCEIDAVTLQMGADANRYARGVLAWCLEHDQWPTHRPRIQSPLRIFTVGAPVWALNEYETRMKDGSLEPPPVRQKEVA